MVATPTCRPANNRLYRRVPYAVLACRRIIICPTRLPELAFNSEAFSRSVGKQWVCTHRAGENLCRVFHVVGAPHLAWTYCFIATKAIHGELSVFVQFQGSVDSLTVQVLSGAARKLPKPSNKTLVIHRKRSCADGTAGTPGSLAMRYITKSAVGAVSPATPVGFLI